MKLLVAGAVILIAYAVLVIQFYTASKKGYNSTADVLLKKGRLAVLNHRHLVSVLAMAAAVLYVGFIKSDWLLLTLPNTSALLLPILVAVAACIISIATARKALRTIAFNNAGSAAGYLFLRALFLIVYELFFRAALFNFCIALVGVPVAVGINVVLYATAHAFSTRQELIGTVPFGMLLCWLTLFSGSVWPAVLIHLLLGLPYDALILRVPKQNRKSF